MNRLKLKIKCQNLQRTKADNPRVSNIVNQADITCCQELYWPTKIKDKQDLIQLLEKKLNCTILISSSINESSLTTFVNKKLSQNIKSFSEIIPGRATILKIENEQYSYNIVNVYGPPKSTNAMKDFCTDLFKRLNGMRHCILLGDWNMMTRQDMCNKGLNIEHRPKCNAVKHLFEDWTDIHDIIHTRLNYTFTRQDYKARLDRIYMDPEITQLVQNYQIIPVNFSDHDQLSLEVKWGKQTKWGKGMWKLNSQILENPDFQAAIKSLVEMHKETKAFHSTMDGWDALKLKFKQTAVRFSTQASREKERKAEELQERVIKAKMNLENNVQIERNQEELENALQQLEILEEETRKSIMIRAKEQELKYDERPTKYFFQKDKQIKIQKHIDTIFKDDNDANEELKSKKAIMTEIEVFYQNLYKVEEIDEKQLDENLKHIKNKLDSEDRQLLNKPITTKEIEKAIKEMKEGKSPGEDGLTKEFYEHFFDILREELCELYNNMVLSRKQPESQKNAIVKLLFKKGDHRKLKNWRPISLLNVDYKILSKIMTTRLSIVMGKLVPTEQKCAVKGRHMTDIIRNIDSYRQSKTGYIVLLDQTKAFDKVSHKYLFKTLQTLGIDGNFLELTKVLYNNISSQIMVNEAMTRKVQIERGVRQGCPLSMTLFILASIPLIEMIKDNTKLHGYRTKRNNIVKIQSYADDNTFLIRHATEYNEILSTYQKHSVASGAQINEDKTEIFRLGEIQSNENDNFKEKIKEKVNIMGAVFCTNKDEETKENLAKPLKTLKELYNKPESKTTSILGKIIKIHTYVYSQIWHAALLIETQTSDFHTFLSHIAKYLQIIKGKEILEKISKRKKEGGLGLINLKERIEAIKLKEILQAENQIPESDNIIYNLGTKQKTIYGKLFPGPKAEEALPQYKQAIRHIEKEKENIKNYKTRKKKMRTKDVQNIIFPKDEVHMYKEIFDSKDPKLTSLNYQILYSLLPTTGNNHCFFCKKESESIEHLYLSCQYLRNVREETKKWLLEENCNDFNKRNILEMEGIRRGIQNLIISVYKQTIWNYRNRAIFKPPAKERTIFTTLEKQVKFHLRHLRSSNTSQNQDERGDSLSI